MVWMVITCDDGPWLFGSDVQFTPKLTNPRRYNLNRWCCTTLTASEFEEKNERSISFAFFIFSAMKYITFAWKYLERGDIVECSVPRMSVWDTVVCHNN